MMTSTHKRQLGSQNYRNFSSTKNLENSFSTTVTSYSYVLGIKRVITPRGTKYHIKSLQMVSGNAAGRLAPLCGQVVDYVDRRRSPKDPSPIGLTTSRLIGLPILKKQEGIKVLVEDKF